MPASVKIMLSYDYCHFEICKGSDENLSNEQIDAMRKDVQRLANKAVEQYKIFKSLAEIKIRRKDEKENSERQCNRILEKPEGQRTLNEVALLKAFKDKNWNEYIDARYDFEDDWDDERFYEENSYL